MMSLKRALLGGLALTMLSQPLLLQAKETDPQQSNPLAAIPLRNIGPAMISGRIADFAVHPQRQNEYFVAAASGNLWKTTNNGTTWQPLFEHEGAYAIGNIEIAKSNPQVIWLGTGENNSQRSVANGDGVYKSVDGGKSWKNMGLKHSGHISTIWIHPQDSNIVIVAAQGPLWSDGGDRGLYKTSDGGESWTQILQIDKLTGINEFVVDPRNPNNIVASSYQRRRHVWALINGGPGSAIHKSSDGGKTWHKISAGLPQDHMGRIGLAMAPSKPDTLYAIIEGSAKEQGVYRSVNFGQSWHKQSSHMTNSPQYYNELVVDPHNPDRLYSLDTFTSVSEDAGKSFQALNNEFRHVDDHALWIDPHNTDHLLIGGDGGVYESWDRGQVWRHMRNLPLAQFYRIQPDNAVPFYNVCGGTQDNNSLCAPSRTQTIHGISNEDWNIVVSGDGYKPQIDPNDANIIYGQSQYGGLVRYDKRSRERVSITPHPDGDENQYKWNWNTPLLLSPHSPTRLFYAAEKLFQSDDRGNSWRVISPDLTRKLDRNKLKIMDRVWGVDTIAKNVSTSKYGAIIALSESPLKEGLIYVGTDDGLISVTEDGGLNWRSEDSFRGVPDMSLVEDIITSVHDENVAYAVFDNHKRGDYKPYVLKTTNKGKSWKLISANLPEWGSAHTIAQDHVDADLLFVGTEYGLFVSQNDGKHWDKMQGNFPTIAVRDLEIQRRESDLVVGTFGRGVYILDDYSPLRTAPSQLAKQAATLFPVKDAWLYLQGHQYGNEQKGSMGNSYFTAPNPMYGAVFSYYLNDGLKTRAKQRREQEIEIEKQGGDTPYPSWDELRKEDREEAPTLLFIIKDSDNKVVARLPAQSSQGFHRVAWDMRYPATTPVNLNKPAGYVPPWARPSVGVLAMPGEYSVTMVKRQDGKLQTLTEPQRFRLKVLANSPELTEDRAALLAFQQGAAQLLGKVTGATASSKELAKRIKHLKQALRLTPASSETMEQQLRAIESRLQQLNVQLTGDSTVSRRQEPVPLSISARIDWIYTAVNHSQFAVSANHKSSLSLAEKQFAQALTELRSISAELSRFEQQMDKLAAPWTPGRVPQ